MPSWNFLSHLFISSNVFLSIDISFPCYINITQPPCRSCDWVLRGVDRSHGQECKCFRWRNSWQLHRQVHWTPRSSAHPFQQECHHCCCEGRILFWLLPHRLRGSEQSNKGHVSPNRTYRLLVRRRKALSGTVRPLRHTDHWCYRRSHSIPVGYRDSVCLSWRSCVRPHPPATRCLHTDHLQGNGYQRVPCHAHRRGDYRLGPIVKCHDEYSNTAGRNGTHPSR